VAGHCDQTQERLKRYNCTFYQRKKLFLKTTMTMTTIQMLTITTTTTQTTTTAALCSDDHWSLNTNGTKRTPSAQRVTKSRQVKPAVDSILRAGNAVQQGFLLRGVLDHPSMFSARKMAAIDSSKESVAAKYVVGQQTRMMERNRKTLTLHGNSTTVKHDAVEVVLAFSAPSPQKTTGVPNRRDCAHALGVPPSTLARMDAHLIEKRWQLTAGKRGVHWALSKRKRGFSKVDEVFRLLLVDAFNDHPHVIVSPNSKDMLQHKNADGEIVLVQKVLTQVGLGSIFSDIVREHPTIKNQVGERAFRYIISGLGCVRCFTDSHKQMCGCTECVGLHSLHRSLQAKRGVMHHKFAINSQRRTSKARAKAMARGWGAVGWHTKPLLAITEGTCMQWTSHAVLHWECQTLQCSDCKQYPIPKEEAREDAGAENISFHVHEYKTSLRKDGKERRWLELVQKHCKIGEFTAFIIGPPSDAGGTT
jgi:hypothetical protein